MTSAMLASTLIPSGTNSYFDIRPRESGRNSVLQTPSLLGSPTTYFDMKGRDSATIRALSPLGSPLRDVSFVEMGYGTGDSSASTPAVQSPILSPVKKAMPARVALLARNDGFEISTRSALSRSKKIPGEDSFLHDITSALEKV